MCSTRAIIDLLMRQAKITAATTNQYRAACSDTRNICGGGVSALKPIPRFQLLNEYDIASSKTSTLHRIRRTMTPGLRSRSMMIKVIVICRP